MYARSPMSEALSTLHLTWLSKSEFLQKKFQKCVFLILTIKLCFLHICEKKLFPPPDALFAHYFTGITRVHLAFYLLLSAHMSPRMKLSSRWLLWLRHSSDTARTGMYSWTVFFRTSWNWTSDKGSKNCLICAIRVLSARSFPTYTPSPVKIVSIRALVSLNILFEVYLQTLSYSYQDLELTYNKFNTYHWNNVLNGLIQSLLFLDVIPKGKQTNKGLINVVWLGL